MTIEPKVKQRPCKLVMGIADRTQTVEKICIVSSEMALMLFPDAKVVV